MKKQTRDTILQCAKAAREWAEAYDQRHGPYTPGLCGLCAIASAELKVLLAKQGIEAELHMYTGSFSHVFVVAEDHVIDVTATQFNETKNRKIVFMHMKEAEGAYHFYQSDYTFRTAEELQSLQENARWPLSQTVLDTSVSAEKKLKNDNKAIT